MLIAWMQGILICYSNLTPNRPCRIRLLSRTNEVVEGIYEGEMGLNSFERLSIRLTTRRAFFHCVYDFSGRLCHCLNAGLVAIRTLLGRG